MFNIKVNGVPYIWALFFTITRMLITKKKLKEKVNYLTISTQERKNLTPNNFHMALIN